MEGHAEYAGRLLAGRYRLPLPPADAYELAESPAWDTVGGQEVLVRQVPLPEVVEAEVVEAELLDDSRGGYGYGGGSAVRGAAEPVRPGYPGGPGGGRATRRPDDPVVRRAMEAAVAAAQLPDHPGLDQVFDVFVEDDGLWIVSEQVPARSLAALLSERPLSAHRAAEIAADLLAALGVVHVHGWVHRNVTARTVLICEDGRAMLTGLAVGAAEEALCGYDPLPEADEPGAAPAPPESSPAGDGAPGTRPQPQAQIPSQAQPQSQAQPRTEAPTDAVPATWTGRRLPEGFTARGEDPYDPRGQGRGIFGFEGIDPDEDVRGPRGRGVRRPGSGAGGEPGGDGTADPAADPAADPLAARAARRGAIAAYREGAQRAVADTRSAERRAGGPGPEHGGAPHGAGAGDHRQQVTDWWSTAPGGRNGGGDGHHPPGALDDEVRWLSSDEDEVRPDALEEGGGGRQVERDEIYGPRAAGPYGAGASPYGGSGPTALPGAPRQDGRSVPAQWTTGPGHPDETRRHLRGLPASSPNGEADGDAGEGAAHGESAFHGEGAPHGGRALHGEGALQDEHAFPGEDGSYAPEPGGVPADRPWGEAAEAEAVAGRFRGPATALAAERARHARMTVVGPVTERWAPEQAGPVYENWRLAPPVGPAADLWALGALLFRAVQGHAPYPEDSAAELAQMVCAEPPAFAEDCGPLRPVVESLMRQDPTERPDFEELRGWLRSLVRSAPEPDVGLRTVTAPSLEPGGPSDPRRLPIVRRRGELVRRRRRSRRPDGRGRPRGERAQPSARAPVTAPDRTEVLGPERLPEYEPAGAPTRAVPREKREREQRSGGAGPRRLGLVILGLVLLGMAAAVAFVMWFLPDNEKGGGNQKGSVVVPEEQDRAPADGDDSGNDDSGNDDSRNDESGKDDSGKDGSGGGGEKGESGKGSASSAGPGAKSPRAPEGYKTSQDPAGFRIAVPEEWDRRSANGRGQVRYNGGQVEMVVVGGRDSTKKYGKDPMAYQSEDEPELSAYRAADWASTGGLRRIDVGDTAMAEGTFSWREGGGRQVYARNRAMILDGRYHVLLVIGSKSHRAEIDRHFEAVADTYRVTGVR